MARKSNWWIAGLALLCVAGIALIHADYGITWDEDVQARYGEKALDYFLSGGQDTSANSYFNLKYYGPLFESVCAALYRFLQTDPYLTRHFCIALTALLAVLALILTGRLYKDARLAIELDGAQHLEADAYRRDRRKDALLQENGWFVLRFLAEDVGKHLDETLDTILRALTHRRKG